MASFTGPNVSQFLRELQENPTAIDGSSEAGYALDDQTMSMFTNTEFFDFETGQNTDFQPQPPSKSDSDALARSDGGASASTEIEDFTSLDFSMPGDFGFSDFGNTYTSPTMTNFPDALGNLQPIQPSPQTVYAAVPQHHSQRQSTYPPAPRIGDKHKSEAASPAGRPVSFEEQTRYAAEEDKRRRNTAASARFRVKKKQREQALEKSAKEMGDKVTALEGRIQQLETENKWLKNIVLEKNGGNEEFLATLLDDCKAKNQTELKKQEDEEPSTLKAPTSPEEREAGDSSG